MGLRLVRLKRIAQATGSALYLRRVTAAEWPGLLPLLKERLAKGCELAAVRQGKGGGRVVVSLRSRLPGDDPGHKINHDELGLALAELGGGEVLVGEAILTEEVSCVASTK